MKSHLPVFAAVFRIGIIVALGMPGYVSAQAPTGVPDLNGVWQAPYSPNLAQVLGHEPPYTPYGLQRAKTVDYAKDPTGLCLPPGPARAIQSPLPFQIVQTPSVVMLAFEYQRTFRMIYTDGSPHPPEIQDNLEFMGHSTGKWEGDTLVVDTVGINDRSWLDTAGHEHSDKLRITERFQKTGQDVIKWTVTFEDPVFFTEPFTVTRNLTRQKTRIMDYSCNDNNHDLQHVQPTIGIPAVVGK
jgi:hypothetical protein